MLERIVAAGGTFGSFSIAAKMFKLLTDLVIAERTINNTTIAIGNELAQSRAAMTDAHLARPITAPARIAEPAVSLAVAQVDGGRMQTRTVGRGSGVHDPHWRESKNAGLYRMIGETFGDDPHPQLPSCFTSPKQMAGLLHGSGELDAQESVEGSRPDLSWRPKSLVRTCVSSLCDSRRFGETMSAEAERRGFYSADRRAFLGDGLPYNWTIQQEHFETFTPILDFIHPIERLHELSRVLFDDAEEAWQQYGKWIELVWLGDVSELIGILAAEQQSRGEAEPGSDENDPRHKLSETLGYLRNNVSRMNYPAYRTAGLPNGRLADDKLPDRVASQRDQPPRQRKRKILERWPIRRSDPAPASGPDQRRRPARRPHGRASRPPLHTRIQERQATHDDLAID